ncbi:Uncharacterized protein family UPF0283 [Pseudodesulfovibrio aespoeensis Aspo-2]|uniref:Uncharacterized protein family UPF0283 n=2 Tax=Pseudodesulfovibrio aespoeensis TaxID=182210 RepID=E6VXC7_PSEA9|nr:MULTISPECIES: DUF697 domain-containing protein [Pseudodesulfovibrio]ADU63743.1 Uncharacterized protein family UPF0283 [Pseudodesulfovibrio aespoeensis Aspo-2]MCG2732551.1 DUF697 domain-containing protein [Pseudodesulfovibrio aespoeensis]
MKNLLTLVGVIIVASFLAFLYESVAGLAAFAGRFNPALEPWAFWALFIPVLVSLGWALAVALVRPKPMLVYADPTPEDLAEFRRTLGQRLRSNRTLREAGVRVVSDADLEAALGVLKARADSEIRTTAKQVFISTALAQNGRLDALVVLFLITRLTWRISRLYNQRPHYREMINLYANIAVTSFLAGAIDELGVDEYVRELMGPLVGGSAIGAVPGAQAVAGVITASVLSGSTNCLLTLRCGIVARDYLSLRLDARGAMRRSATLEASKLFVTMSAETVLYVTKALVRGSTSAVRSGSVRAFQGVSGAVSGAVSGTVGAVGGGTRSLGRTVGQAAGRAGAAARSAAAKALERLRAVRKGAKSRAGGVAGKTTGKAAADQGRIARAGRRVAGFFGRGKAKAASGDDPRG